MSKWSESPDAREPFDEGLLDAVYESLPDGNGLNSAVVERMQRADSVLVIVDEFIRRQRIGCAETVSQTDRVIVNAYEFIEELCEAAGYYKDDSEA